MSKRLTLLPKVLRLKIFLQDGKRPASNKNLLKVCNESILSCPLHENLKIVQVSFAAIKAASREDKDLVVDTVLKLLAFPDVQVAARLTQ